MPNVDTHCAISKERTQGNEYRELHEWMDKGQEYLEENHRFERHSGAYIKYVLKEWKKEGVIEFLNHIIDDFKDTLSKWENGYDIICVKCGKPDKIPFSPSDKKKYHCWDCYDKLED